MLPFIWLAASLVTYKSQKSGRRWGPLCVRWITLNDYFQCNQIFRPWMTIFMHYIHQDGGAIISALSPPTEFTFLMFYRHLSQYVHRIIWDCFQQWIIMYLMLQSIFHPLNTAQDPIQLWFKRKTMSNEKFSLISRWMSNATVVYSSMKWHLKSLVRRQTSFVACISLLPRFVSLCTISGLQ